MYQHSEYDLWASSGVLKLVHISLRPSISSDYTSAIAVSCIKSVASVFTWQHDCILIWGEPVQWDGFWAWLPCALLTPNVVKSIAIFISSGRVFCSQCSIASPVTTGFLRFPNSLIALCYVRLHFQREKELSHTARALQTSQHSWNAVFVQWLAGKENQ